MSEERTLGTMTPALPSRATGEAKPLTPLPTAGVDHATLPKARKASVAIGRKKSRPARLPAREIKRINKNRRKNLKKKKRVVVPPAPKNPNRPLEAKNRLRSVMRLVADISKPEMQAFMGAMSVLEDLSRGARLKVIGSLGQAYS